MALSADEKKLLDELTLKASAPDAEDWDLEIFDMGTQKGARLPVSKAGNWLYETFGIGEAPAAAVSDDGTEEDKKVKVGRFGVRS